MKNGDRYRRHRGQWLRREVAEQAKRAPNPKEAYEDVASKSDYPTWHRATQQRDTHRTIPAGLLSLCFHLPSSSGSLAIFAAIRRASSFKLLIAKH